MKSILLLGSLILILVLNSCTTTHYVTRPASSGKYYGRTGKHHNDNNKNFNRGHSNRGSTGHHRS